MSVPPVVVALGRNGDILNALPIAYELFKRGQKPKFLVSKNHVGILEAVSYVDPVVWDGDYSKPAEAIMWFKRHYGQHPIIVAQCYMNGDQRHMTDSYQKESWRIAGWLDRFATLPLVLNTRNRDREKTLVEKWTVTKETILVAPDGISSKYFKAAELMKSLQEKFADRHILDLRKVKGEYVYDLLGLFDAAGLLISVDTVHLHLARCSDIPLIAITNVDWKGSVCPPNTWAKFEYGSHVKFIVQEVENFFAPEVSPSVFHVCDLFGKSERHERAQSSWMAANLTPRHKTEWPRTSQSINDERNLPYLKDVLSYGMEGARDEDVVIWTNDDIGLDRDVGNWAEDHTHRWGAVSMRRNSPHMGRDLFAFRVWWLKHFWNDIPDFLLGAPFWDIVLAALIRKKCRINSTKENLEHDIFPCETPHRYALHEDHISEWKKGEYTYPGNQYNRRLFLEWTRKEMPTLKI